MKDIIARARELRRLREFHSIAGLSELANAAPTLAAECERLLEIIEAAPHSPRCGARYGRNLKPAGCTCWKSRALAEMEDQTK